MHQAPFNILYFVYQQQFENEKLLSPSYCDYETEVQQSELISSHSYT